MPFRWVGRHQGGQDVAAHRPKAFRQYLRPLPPGTPEALHPPHQCLAQQQSLKHPRRPDPPPPPQRALAFGQLQRTHRLTGRRHLLPARLHPGLRPPRQVVLPPPARALAASDGLRQPLVGGPSTDVFLDRVVAYRARVAPVRHHAVWDRDDPPTAPTADVTLLEHLHVGSRAVLYRHHPHPVVVHTQLLGPAMRALLQHPLPQPLRCVLDVAAHRDEDRHAHPRRYARRLGSRDRQSSNDSAVPSFSSTQHDRPGFR